MKTMNFTELVAAYAGKTQEGQIKGLTDILATLIAEKFGRGLRALPKIAETIPYLCEEQDIADTLPLLIVLDAIIGCIARKMLTCEGFDVLNLRNAAEQFMVNDCARREQITCEAHRAI